MHDDIASLRLDYGSRGFNADDAGNDPMRLFTRWFADARSSASVAEANAMALATSTADGVPSVRMVLLKDIDEQRTAFTWFTNLTSRKAREAFARQPGRAALVWWWPGDEHVAGRQVRVVGTLELVARADVAAYFASRPRDAQIGAVVSHQSQPISTRAELDDQAQSLEDANIEVPDTWGGITLIADELEFWQGRSGRLHDRFTFVREATCPAIPNHATIVTDASGADWYRVRLQP